MPEKSPDIRCFNSYRSLFRINYKIYEIGGKVLPRAIPLDVLLIMAALYLPCLPVGWLISHAHPFIMALVISGVVAWTISQTDPQGKILPVFAWDIINYIGRPKKTNLAGRNIPKMRRKRLEWHAMEVIDEISNHSF